MYNGSQQAVALRFAARLSGLASGLAVVGKHADELVFTAPGGVLRLPNWRRSVFMPAAATPVSATGSGSMTCGIPPHR